MGGSLDTTSTTTLSGRCRSLDTAFLFRDVLPRPGQAFSIDTSLAKSNTQVVSMCAQRLGIEEVSGAGGRAQLEQFPNGRPDGKPCSIYWHSQVHNDMKTFIRSPEARVNKFPGERLNQLFGNSSGQCQCGRP